MNNAELIRRDLAHIWHPCTQMQDHEWLPLVPIRSGTGAWLEDFDGKRYLDAIGSWWTNIIGHRHPRVMDALRRQMDKLDHVLLAGFTHEAVVQLSEQLCELAPPGLSKCFYADNGSSAVEVALKMSYHYWQNCGEKRGRFITLSNSYHGETLGALGLSDVGLYRDTYAPLLLDAIVVPGPDCSLLREGGREPGESQEAFCHRQFAHMRKTLEAHAHETCAVIVEPLVQCAGYMRMYHGEYLRLLRVACDEFNVHLIADEIAVGFGRTDSLFACEQVGEHGITPDFMCLSKGLTAGSMPLSVTLTNEKVYAAFYADYSTLKAFLHSHSFTGNPLACSTALGTLAAFREDGMLDQARLLGTRMQAATAGLEEHPHVGEIRRTGAILAIELVQDKASGAPYPWQERRGLRVYQHALQKGVLLRPLGNVVYFMPPYVLNEEDVALMVNVARSGIDAACAGEA